MNLVFGTEDSSNPPLICEPNAPQLLNSYEQPELSRLTPELTPTPSQANDDASELSSFNSGKKIKGKKTTQSEILVDMLIKNMEFEEERREEKEQREVMEEQRAEQREVRADKLINILETLVQHLTKE